MFSFVSLSTDNTCPEREIPNLQNPFSDFDSIRKINVKSCEPIQGREALRYFKKLLVQTKCAGSDFLLSPGKKSFGQLGRN